MKSRSRVLASLALAASLSDCTCHSTAATEVGVLTRKVSFFGLLGKPGVNDESYGPGATYFFPAFVTDWHVYDVALQNLEMVSDATRGDRPSSDEIEFKTADGNDIRVDVTVAWRLDPKRVAYLLVRVAGSTHEVKEALVRPTCRSVVRDVLNEMTSEQFYNSDKRFEKAEAARVRLAELLAPEGVIVERVILGEHRFNPDYEKVIHDKKVAEQNGERMRSEGKAAVELVKRNVATARGVVEQKIAQAKGELDKVKLAADADYYQRQQQATATLAEAQAHAKGIQKQNEALAGAGGRTLVKLRLAEALMDKPILFLPTAHGGGLSTLNLNDLLQKFAIGAAATAPPPASDAK